MKFEVDCSRIFFDKYSLSEREKEDNAKYIVEKVLNEIGIDFTNDNLVFTVADNDFEKGMKVIKEVKTLKEEFFIIIKTKSDNEEINPVPSSEETRDEAEDYIYKNYQYDYLSPQYVCDALNLNRKRTDALFLKKHNVTMREFILRVRVEKAKKMLLEGLNNEQCAECAGFGSVKTMQRAFKNICGQTPMEYKASCIDSKKVK
ncbi:MAG: helix-turn-helix domain-containing protein [Clostridia bacterium]